MNNKIAVIILNYFGFQDTIKCVRSVQQTLKSHIFLVDNSADYLEKNRIISFFQGMEKIHLYFPDANIGFAAGVNFAIKKAIIKGFSRFLLLNNDAVLMKGAGSQIIEAYNKWPGTLFAPIIKWGDRINRGNYYHRYLGLIVNNRNVKSHHWVYYLTGCALAFDINFLAKVGVMNETFFMYGEDVELSFRALEKGAPIKILNKVLVYHEGSNSSGMASFFYEYHMARMHYHMSFLLFKRPIEKALSILCKIIMLSIRAGIRSIRYRTWSPLVALLLSPFALKIRPNKKR